MELDSHADTCAFGKNCWLVNDTGQLVTVEGFNQQSMALDGVSIADVAVAYDCPTTFKTFILFFHQALYIPSMEVHLASTFQMRENGVTVNAIPLLHIDPDKRTPEDHSILTKDPLMQIPLSLKGTMSGFNIRIPTQEEIQDTEQINCTHVNMTVDSEWDPHSKDYKKLEASLRDYISSDYDLRILEPRDIYPLQVRGQDHGDLDLSIPIEGSDMEESEEESEEEPEESPRKLSRLEVLRESQRHTDALDVDMYAEALLDELGVEELGRNLGALGVSLASGTTIKKKRKGFVSPEKLAKNWKIGLEVAKRTVEATTQLAVRDFTHTTGGRRLKPYAWVLKHRRLEAEVFSDTMFGKVKSLRGNTCCQIFATAFHFVRAYPMASKKDAHYALDKFFEQIGVPRCIIPDNAKEMTEGPWKKKCARAQVPIHPIEAYTPNANLAEDNIREAKRLFERTMLRTNAPEVIWDDCFEWCTLIRSHVAWNIKALDGETPTTKMSGDTCDISFLAEFGFYDWVWYITPQQDGTLQRKKLGRYLGPSLSVGDAMCGTILTEKATRLQRTSIIPLSDEDNNSEAIDEMKAKYEKVLAEKLKHRVAGLKAGKEPAKLDEEAMATPDMVPYAPYKPEELGYDPERLEIKPQWPDLPEADEEVDQEEMDLNLNRYISAKVKVPQGGYNFAYGKVIKRARDECGELIGNSHTNPLLDSSVYEVELEDGSVERYTANIIAEAIYSQIDNDGQTVSLLDEITDHKFDETAIRKEDGTTRGPNGSRKPKVTTRGWKLLARFKDGSESWIKLKDFKESNPLEVADYAVSNQIADEPAFAWWVPFVIKKRNRVLKAMKKRYFRTHSKFGIELPKTIKRALEIDKETGTTFWEDAIKKEMKTVTVAFDILPEGSNKPTGYNYLGCHMVFDVKQGTLQRKARFVGDGHKVEEPKCTTYASVVSRESVRLAFMLASLNGLDILSADAEGAYLNAPTRERLYTKCGPEFGEYEGRYAIIRRALYGTKSAAASWRATISEVIKGLGFKMCRADNDVWMREGFNAAGEKVWEYVLVYSDDLLAVANRPDLIMNQIDQHFKLKEGSVKVPDQYLGADIGKYTLPDGTVAWYMSSESYVKTAVRNVEAWLAKREAGNKNWSGLKTKVSCVFPNGWKPEIDTTPLLNDEDASYYQQQIGVLRWMVELGRIDINTEVSMLAAFSIAPRQGHLAAVLHLYAYLKKHNRSKLVFDSSYVDHDPHPVYDWADFYEIKEEIKPSDMPEARGKKVQTTCWVDSDHSGDLVSRRSRTGVLIFCNKSPIIFYSKKQGSIETSSFGSEFSAMKTAVELVEGLRYKLRMMGCPLDGKTHIKADNMSVVHNCSNPASTLKKKSNSIAYHYVRERCAAGVCSISWCSTLNNLADMFTKSQPGEVRRRLSERVLF